MSLLQVKNLQVGIAGIRPVDGVDLDLDAGQTLAILGESGCGKSLTALALMRLLPPGGRIQGGSIRLEGQELTSLTEQEMRTLRGGRIGMIFQEPMTSLNPVARIGEQIAEAVRLHDADHAQNPMPRVLDLLQAVGIPDPKQRIQEYPHQMSGGMKQRVMIAMALAGRPRLLIADEPTTALDVTIQAQVLHLLKALQRETGMAVLLITHDLGVVAEVADQVAVSYAGQILERAPVADFFENPRHPYSRKLFASLPSAMQRGAPLAVIAGSVPRLDDLPPGCRFANRCDYAQTACHEAMPPWEEAAPGQGLRCFRWREIASQALASSLALPSVSMPSPPGASHEEGLSDSFPRLPLTGMAELPPLMMKDHARFPHPNPLPEGEGANEHCVTFTLREGLKQEASPPVSPLLRLTNLQVHFPIRKGILRRVHGLVRAVDGLSLELPRGKTLALVGESGCGKTTVGKAILQLIRPSAGEVHFDGLRLDLLKGKALRPLRSRIQIVFQDPFSSMNPRMRVFDILAEGLRAQGWTQNRDNRPATAALSRGGKSIALQQKLTALLEQVGLDPTALNRYPHEFSGGQRQRIAIARALSLEPELIICDEPTSALDVSVQAQILNLLKDLQQRLGVAYLFISHNISAVAYLADEIAVMYLGRIVERGPLELILKGPSHPYTQALLAAVPEPRIQEKAERQLLGGDMPSPINPPSGCHFHPRCPRAQDKCREYYPPETFANDRWLRCFYPLPFENALKMPNNPS